MDLKIGKRTFLESEVSNLKEREDLYLKMVKIDPKAPTPTEHKTKTVTKLRYMQFREQLSSTNEIGFRIEAIKFIDKSDLLDTNELKRTKTENEVRRLISKFLHSTTLEAKQLLCSRLEEIRRTLELSEFFKNHEMIGSSILLIYDGKGKIGAWMIDFAKTMKSPHTLDHRSDWKMGNHEDGFLTGLDNLIKIIQQVI
jgi:1D-myo-inositol-triphosphate 3-kinase